MASEQQQQQHATERPKIAIVQLKKQPYFDDRPHQDIQAKAEVHIANSPQAVSEVLQSAQWPTVLVTDEGLVLGEHSRQKAEAAVFVRNGGTVIIGCHFPCFANMPQIRSLFSGFQLPWVPGSYHRTTVHLNQAMPHVSHQGLPARYSQKALNLSNVNRFDALYLPAESSRIESVVRTFIDGPSAPEDLTETPAALAKVGQGRVGYIGDVNGEQGTKQVTLAMLGLNV